MAHLRFLIATTTWWPSAARLAVAFGQLGAEVSAVCPRGHPLRVLTHLQAIHIYTASDPLQALVRAIRAEKPDVIVPTDDRAVDHLHALHESADRFGADADLLRAVIERSLGTPSGYGLSGKRQRLLDAMRSDGIDVPDGRTIRSPDEMRAWYADFSGTCVVKAEGSWGGSGVVVARTQAAAEAARLEMSQPLALRKALRILLVDRDPFPFVQFMRRERREVMVQRHIVGQQANIMAACWEGEILGSVSVAVLRAQGHTGAATVIRTIDSPEMESAARLMAKRLGLSGFFGLDFMVEEASGRYFLIEMNPRATQLGHLVRKGRSLASCLFTALGGTAPVVENAPDDDRAIALFPQALRFEAAWPELKNAKVDVPWTEPELVAELLRPPWTKRSLLARIETRLRRNDAYGTVLSRRKAAQILATLARQAPAGQAPA